MQKIAMKTPLVELDGDEATRILWQMIKDELILPYIDLKSIYYDLGLPNRDATDDQVTVDASNAIAQYGVGVKCATITPDEGRVREYNLKQMWKSPNATLRGILDGTIFRAPIRLANVKPYVPTWESPITIARHAYGDIYKSVEMVVDKPGTAHIVFTDEDGNETRQLLHKFEQPGILMGMHNLDDSITKFARSCFNYAIDTKQDLWFGTKQTINKQYDGRFMDIFQTLYDTEYAPLFQQHGLSYFYTLIDDAVSRVMRSNGGFIWACKNYDGDVMSDMVSTVYGSLSMMTSVLVSPDGKYEFEAAHGTVTRHYYRYLQGEQLNTNPIATFFAWTGALRQRGKYDGIDALIEYADKMEKATIATVEGGKMTGDLAILSVNKNIQTLNAADFLKEVRKTFDAM